MMLLTTFARLLRLLPVSKTKVRIGRIITRLCVHGRMSSVCAVKMRDGSSLLLDARSRTEAEALWNGEYDRDDIDFFKVCSPAGSVCFDVGANVGLITIPLARHLRENGGGRVISFEPIRANFDRLREVVNLNQLDAIVSPRNIALGENEGEIDMALETKGGSITGNAFMSQIADNLSQYTVSRTRMTRLDTFAEKENIGRVDFIKVDIEGAELMFFRGGLNLLSKCRPIIYGEFHSELMPRFGHSFLDIVEIIRPWNYRVFAFSGRLRPVEVLEPKVGIGNVFLAPSEKVDELLERVEIARRRDAA